MHPMLKYTFAMCLWLAPLASWGGDGGVFWSIEGSAGHAGYLLGTIHSEDPRVLEFSESFIDALAGSDIFAMELVPDLFTMARLAEYMHLPEGESQADLIGDQRFQAVAGALSRYGLPAEQVARMKPWAAMMTLSVPPPSSGLFMDFSLSLRASGAGLEVIGLETLEEQLSFLENLSLEQQLMLLDHAVAEFDQVGEVHTRMVDVYLEGDLNLLDRQASEQMATLDEELRNYFIGEGIIGRNRRMLANLVPALGRGKVFAAVGALHLPGPHGLISLLEGQGFRLVPMDSPFRVAAEGVVSE